MSWQICGECRGCPASSYHKKKCVEKNEEHEEMERLKYERIVYERCEVNEDA